MFCQVQIVIPIIFFAISILRYMVENIVSQHLWSAFEVISKYWNTYCVSRCGPCNIILKTYHPALSWSHNFHSFKEHTCVQKPLYSTPPHFHRSSRQTIKNMKGVGYLLVKCRGHQPPLPSKQGFQRVQRTLRRILHLSLPPEKHQEKQTVQINHSRHTIMWRRKYWGMLQFREICNLSVDVRDVGIHSDAKLTFDKKVKLLCNLVSYTREPFTQKRWFYSYNTYYLIRYSCFNCFLFYL